MLFKRHFESNALALQGDWVKDLEDEMSCAVCQETIVAAHSLVPCGHCFCGNCLFQWLSRKQICPTCRSVTALTLRILCKEVVCQSCRSVTAFTLRALCKEVVCVSCRSVILLSVTHWQRKQICPTCWAIRTHVNIKDVLSRLAPVFLW